MITPQNNSIFAYTDYPQWDGLLCVKHYLSVVSKAYCASIRNSSDFVCPKKSKIKRAVAGSIAHGYRLRAKPTVEQEKLLNRILGASRWVWNWGLALYLEHENKHNNGKHSSKTSTKSTTKFSEAKLTHNQISQRLTELKNTTQPKLKNGVVVHDKHWLNSIPDTVLRQSLMDLSNTWKAYESGKQGTRRDTPGKPKFKSKTNDTDSATFQVDARVESKSSCMNHANATIKIPAVEKPHNTLAFKKTEDILGEISSFVVSRKNGVYTLSLSMINIAPEQIQHNKMKTVESKVNKFVDFAYDEYPICSTLNPNKDGLIAIDMAVKWGGVATQDGKTTHQLISQEQRTLALQKEHNTKRFQRAQSRKIEAKYQEYGIVREANGAWPKDAGKILAEKVQERNAQHKKNIQHTIEQDLSLSTLEKQEKIANIQDVFFSKSKRQIAVEQRLSKKHTLKRNYLCDVIHKITTTIVRENHTIVLESLNIKAMLEDEEKSSGFKRSVANTCMSEITRQLKYKARWYGRNMIFVSPWFASSQLCSTHGCTYQNKTLKLSDTHWTCPVCGTYHERNSNASFNLWFQGWQLLEEFFQQNSTQNLADGSFVKGSQGIYEKSISVAEHKALKNATSGKSSRKKTNSTTVQRFSKTA